jgi:hypothetical protein
MSEIDSLKRQLAALEEELKRETVAMEGKKILINGTFGKLGSKYSVLYSPDLLIQVTLTGQLALLMLIEALALPGVEVVSANTDGVMVACHKDLEPDVLQAVKQWEQTTGYVTERADFQSIFARDVNNYVAIKLDGTTKSKGAYGKGLPLHKNPNAEICGDAVLDYLMFGASIEQSIRLCTDIRKFVKVQKVTGGAKYQEKPIGKVARWYYANDSTDAIYYALNDRLVPQTEGAKPLVELPFELPEDLNYDWYIHEAKTMVWDLGLDVDGEWPPEKVRKTRKKKELAHV